MREGVSDTAMSAKVKSFPISLIDTISDIGYEGNEPMETIMRYGQRGGIGATRGRRAETLRDPVSGATKRVFFGQRFILFQQQDESARPLVTAFGTRQEAERVRSAASRFGYDVEYVVEAEVVA